MKRSFDWNQVESLFEQVIRLPDEQRSTFMQTACGADADLLREVQSLVQSHERLQETDSLTQVVSEGVQDWATDSRRLREDSKSVRHEIKDAMAVQARAILEQLQPDFEVLELISRGGTGVVYRVLQKSLSREIAVKVLLTAQLDSKSRERFLRESKAAAKVKNDHVVEIFSVEDSPELTFLAMELIPGPNLKQLIQTRTRIEPETAAVIATQVAIGLEAAHRHDLIHRDVKPANIILDADLGDSPREEMRAKLIDFGIVRDLKSDGQTIDNSVIGTPAYMSPEQLFAPKDTDLRSDVYGLGMTLYEMLSGTLPFQGAPHMVMRQIDSQEPVSLRKLDDRIPRDLESICFKAISKAPGKRYQSAKEMREDLERFIAGQPTVARPIPVASKVYRWCNRNRPIAASLFLALTLVVALVSGSLAFAFTVAGKNREIQRHRVASMDTRIQAVIDSDPGHLSDAIVNLGTLEPSAKQRFHDILNDSEHGINRKLNAAVALASAGDFQSEFIINALDELYVHPNVCKNLLLALRQDDSAAELLRQSLANAEQPEEKAKRMILLMHLGEPNEWKKAATNQEDPTARTALIQLFGRWHGDLKEFSEFLFENRNEPWAWSLCEALCEVDRRSLNQRTLQHVADNLAQMKDVPSYTAYHFAQLALRNLAPARIQKIDYDHPGCRTFEGNYHLIRIEPAETKLGRFDKTRFDRDHPPRTVKLTRAYYISDAEISVGQFAEFAVDELGAASVDDWLKQGGYDQKISPSSGHPVQQVSWYDAVRFCNWLSRKHGLQPAYIRKESGQAGNQAGNQENRQGNARTRDIRWRLDREASGFRLPTDAEWEFASRNHSTTRYFFGSDDRYFDDYGIGSSGRSIESAPVRNHRPNSNGIYGMLGNVWEWVHNRYEFEEPMEGSLVDPYGPDSNSGGPVDRVYQGGGINTLQGGIDSESRGHGPPSAQYNNLGFRIALPARASR